jgi:hypothetical protein
MNCSYSVYASNFLTAISTIWYENILFLFKSLIQTELNMNSHTVGFQKEIRFSFIQPHSPGTEIFW